MNLSIEHVVIAWAVLATLCFITQAVCNTVKAGYAPLTEENAVREVLRGMLESGELRDILIPDEPEEPQGMWKVKTYGVPPSHLASLLNHLNQCGPEDSDGPDQGFYAKPGVN